MPPRTRATKTTKMLKENKIVGSKHGFKKVGLSSKITRKPLSDKTNSASDDNESVSNMKKLSSKPAELQKAEIVILNRPRRERRAPKRLLENNLVNNMTPNIKSVPEASSPKKINTPVKHIDSDESFKTPQKHLDSSLIANRPKRICRLPSRFEDHSISPSKFIPVKPCHASTPIVQNQGTTQKSTKINDTPTLPKFTKPSNKEQTKQKEQLEKKADSNNGENKIRVLRNRKKQISETQSPKAKQSGIKNKADKQFLFRVLEDKTTQSKNDKSDIYEFTFDPNEEPPPQKKKKKRVVRKKTKQPKPFVLKNNYDKNVSKALSALKNVVAKNSTRTKVDQLQSISKSNSPGDKNTDHAITGIQDNIGQNVQNSVNNLETETNSMRVHNLPEDLEPIMEHHDDIDYSPVASPNHPKSPRENSVCLTHKNDPLNLQNDLSFFDDPPIASSSMNVSTRDPLASPWRVEFESLPIRWQKNTYVKPNMTPALECSFININNKKKKHVYTNMVPENNDVLPEIIDNNAPQLKQTSILSFIREVAEKSANKKKKVSTLVKANSVFEDFSFVSNICNADVTNSDQNHVSYKQNNKTPEQVQEVMKGNENGNNNKENYRPSRKRKNNSDPNVAPAKTPRKENDNNCTLFGFDDSENQDQENASPLENINRNRGRTLRTRSRTALKEVNKQTGPSRANLPVAIKSTFGLGSDAVNKVYEDMKSAADAPVFPPENNPEATTVTEPLNEETHEDDAQSVHLFEDIELVHHLKSTRKSYGAKPKKVTFRQNSLSDSDTQEPEEPVGSSDIEDLDDLSFKLPSVKEKKVTKKRETKKKKLSKKEKAEIDAWAAGFNSMCEDVEEFDLVVE